jgi:GAF domain-containing protein
LPVFDQFAKLAAQRLEAPVALVTLVDADGQVFPGAFGLSEPWLSERATPLSHSFCQHVVTGEEAFVVENANDDDLVRENLAVMELGVIAYAGVPLHRGSGAVVGAVCAIDHRPRRWTGAEIAELSEIAADVSQELGARLRRSD